VTEETAGRVIVGFPAGGRANARLITITDADTAEPMYSVTKMVLTADCNDAGRRIFADLTMFASDPPVMDDQGSFEMVTKRWLVAEFR